MRVSVEGCRGFRLSSPTFHALFPSNSKATSTSPRSVQGRGDQRGVRGLCPLPLQPPSRAQSWPLPLFPITNCRNTPAAHPSCFEQACMCTGVRSKPPGPCTQHSFIHSFNKVLSTCSALAPMLGTGDRGGQGILGSCLQDRSSEGRKRLTSNYCAMCFGVLRPGEHMGGRCLEVKGGVIVLGGGWQSGKATWRKQPSQDPKTE